MTDTDDDHFRDLFKDLFPKRDPNKTIILVHTYAGLEELIEEFKPQVDAGRLTVNQAWQLFSHRAFESIAISQRRTKKDLVAIAKLALDFERWCGSHRRRS